MEFNFQLMIKIMIKMIHIIVLKDIMEDDDIHIVMFKINISYNIR